MTGWHVYMPTIPLPTLQAVACCARMHASRAVAPQLPLLRQELNGLPARRPNAHSGHAAHFMAGWISKLRTRAGPAVRSDSCSRCRCTRRRTADCCLRPAARHQPVSEQLQSCLRLRGGCTINAQAVQCAASWNSAHAIQADSMSAAPAATHTATASPLLDRPLGRYNAGSSRLRPGWHGGQKRGQLTTCCYRSQPDIRAEAEAAHRLSACWRIGNPAWHKGQKEDLLTA